MLPAAPSLWLTATQAPRSSAVQAGAAAGAAGEVSAVSTGPDEPAATAAEAAISPAAEAAAMTAAARRAVFGIVVRYFMSGRPVVARDPLFTASICLLRLRWPVFGWVPWSEAEPSRGRLVR